MALILRAFSIQESLDFSMSGSTRKVREILVLPHTHHDVGYTDTPSESEMLHLEALSTGINLSLEDAKPGHAQMKWTVEVSRPLLRLLDSDPRAIERVLKANQKGRLAITGGYLNMTQLVGHGGYDRMLSWLDMESQIFSWHSIQIMAALQLHNHQSFGGKAQTLQKSW